MKLVKKQGTNSSTVHAAVLGATIAPFRMKAILVMQGHAE